MIDGGLVDIVPPVPGSVKVCVFPGATLRRKDIDISPALIKDFPFTLQQLARWAFIAPQVS